MTYFITGTDTDCGKTFIASALLYLARQTGTTLGIKPIASGCQLTEQGLRNSDALSLIAQSTLKLDYRQVNPFAFVPAIAPHIAAMQVNRPLAHQTIVDHLNGLPFDAVDFSLIEGAGGWRLPLNNRQFLSQVVQSLTLPVILVVGVKLGCLNHALLTQEALQNDGIIVAGWVANIIDADMNNADENLDTLFMLMNSPCLGTVPYLQTNSIADASNYLTLPKLNR